jgi:hypothetical protein
MLGRPGNSVRGPRVLACCRNVDRKSRSGRLSYARASPVHVVRVLLCCQKIDCRSRSGRLSYARVSPVCVVRVLLCCQTLDRKSRSGRYSWASPSWVLSFLLRSSVGQQPYLWPLVQREQWYCARASPVHVVRVLLCCQTCDCRGHTSSPWSYE